MTDMLDAYSQNKSEQNQRAVREAIPLIVESVKLIFRDFGDDILKHFYDVKDERQVFGCCIQIPYFLEVLEDTLETMSRNHGLRTKPYRDWLMDKYIGILGIIHEVHTGHTMLPVQHKQKKEIGKEIPRVTSELRIQVPKYDENDLYA